MHLSNSAEPGSKANINTNVLRREIHPHTNRPRSYKHIPYSLIYASVTVSLTVCVAYVQRSNQIIHVTDEKA